MSLVPSGHAGRHEGASSVAPVSNNGMGDRLKSVPHSVSSRSLRPSLALAHRSLTAKRHFESDSERDAETFSLHMSVIHACSANGHARTA